MTLSEIAKARLISQQIAGTGCDTVQEAVSRMGAMQAQDLSMAKWAVGVRLPGSTQKAIDAAIDRGEIIRTHALRPTWHFLPADDVYWMLELTAPNIISSLKSRHRQLEINANAVAQSNSIIEKALTDKGQLSRQELIAEFKRADIALNDNRAAHLLLRAELDLIICSGKAKGRETTYALLAEKVPKKTTFDRDEALARVAHTYFSSHGPATLQDFVWWSGFSVGDAKTALEMAKSDLNSETIDSQVYWFTNSADFSGSSGAPLYLLPAFDEFIIGYKDRSAVLTSENHKKAVSNNGIFRPTIVVDGKVEGLWKRTFKKNKVVVEADYFNHANISLEKAGTTFAHFLDKEFALA